VLGQVGLPGQAVVGVHVGVHVDARGCVRHRLSQQRGQRRAQLPGRHRPGVGDGPDGGPRHTVEPGVLRLLDERQPAALPDRGQSRRAVVQRPGQHYADHPGPAPPSGRAEQRVDGGPDPVLARSAAEPHGVLRPDEQVYPTGSG
jgi:hypothetical protein